MCWRGKWSDLLTSRCFSSRMCSSDLDFLMQWRVSQMTLGVEPVPATFGQDTRDKSSAHCRVNIQRQTTIHTHSHTKVKLKQPVCMSPECMSLDCGRNPGDLETAHTDIQTPTQNLFVERPQCSSFHHWFGFNNIKMIDYASNGTFGRLYCWLSL